MKNEKELTHIKNTESKKVSHTPAPYTVFFNEMKFWPSDLLQDHDNNDLEEGLKAETSS